MIRGPILPSVWLPTRNPFIVALLPHFMGKDSESGCCGSCGKSACSDKHSSQDLVRRAFVLQASLSFDAKEIKHQLPKSRSRLAPHLKTIKDRDIPWLVSLKDALPGIIAQIRTRDSGLAKAFEDAKVGKVLEEELALLNNLSKDIQSVIDGSTDVTGAMDDCDRLDALSKPLFPLFAQAKDSLGILKAHGAI